jgi:hypothetical protein
VSAPTVPAVKCPAGCIAPHDVDNTFHYFNVEKVTDESGVSVFIEGSVDAATGTGAVHITQGELSPAAARRAAAAVERIADQVDSALRSL